MPEKNKFQQKAVLIACVLSFVISFVTAGMVAVFFYTPTGKTGNQSSRTNAEPSLPPLVAEPERIDFGEVNEGEHEGTVNLVNNSDRTISILFTDSSCRCSAVKISANTILPGEKVPVQCTLSTSGRVSDRVGGEIWIAFRFAGDEGDDALPPNYVRVALSAVIRAH